MEFIKNFATESELGELDQQCIQAARWALVEQGPLTTLMPVLQQTYYKDGNWQDYVPQVVKQMYYRIQVRDNLVLRGVQLIAYSQEPRYQVTGTDLVLYLDRAGEWRGTAVILKPEDGVIDPMDFGELRFVLHIQLA